MSDLVWKDEYSIGHYQTDHEHKELIALANRVIHFSRTGEKPANIKAAVKALADYSKIHFRNEEAYMERIGFAGLDEHRQIHEALVQRMNTVLTSSQNLDDLVMGLKRLMVVWVIEHIIHEDSKIKQ